MGGLLVGGLGLGGHGGQQNGRSRQSRCPSLPLSLLHTHTPSSPNLWFPSYTLCTLHLLDHITPAFFVNSAAFHNFHKKIPPFPPHKGRETAARGQRFTEQAIR
ncbi:hypothetical protein B5F22_11030 [Pseudoflavonifractor sp. An187]|nr:hypothetical protein B5F22_11030 [Pseudoflavonifractor sp. An187]